MPEVYLPRFNQLFQALSGQEVATASKDEHGWVLLPAPGLMDEKMQYELSVIKALGSRAEGGDLWVKPWPNLEEGRFVMLVLSSDASFRYLPDGREGQRHAYYIHRIGIGGITGAPMLLGQLLVEFEQETDLALDLDNGDTNRIYYPKDKRVTAYEQPTDFEVAEIRARLERLSQGYVGNRTETLRAVLAAA